MSDFGGTLKQAREERGVSLRQIATATKISVVALEALERNDFSRLPGGIFSRAFVRAYALEVGLDPEKTVEEFLVEWEKHGNEIAENSAPEVTADDRAFLERQRRAARWLRGVSLGVVLAIAAAVIAWRMSLRPPAPDVETSAAAADPLPVAPPPPAAGTATGSGRATTTAEASTPIAPAASTPVASAGDRAAAPPAASSVAPDQVALHIEATGECWVRVTVDDFVQIERTLKTGDTRDVKPGRDVLLQVGNAGALKWSVNGQPAKDLGRSGETASARITRATVGQFIR